MSFFIDNDLILLIYNSINSFEPSGISDVSVICENKYKRTKKTWKVHRSAAQFFH